MDNPITSPNQAQIILWDQLNDLCHPVKAVPLHYVGQNTADFTAPDVTKMFLCLWFTAGNPGALGWAAPPQVEFFNFFNVKDYGLGDNTNYFNGMSYNFVANEVERANFYFNTFASPGAHYLYFSFTGFRLTLVP
jgi:hypothetical protein